MFSQYGEDEYILKVLDGIHRGRLLDIGAWHCETFSNSKALLDAGWGGVLVEPSPGPLRGLVAAYADRHDIEVIGGAITVEGGPLRLAVTDDAVSMPTADPSRFAEWSKTGGFYGTMTTLSISLTQFFAGWGGDFEFISIDVEGQSVDLFAEMIRIGPRPRCVCVEHDSRFVELSQHAEKGNYQMVHENGTNRVYEWTGGRE